MSPKCCHFALAACIIFSTVFQYTKAETECWEFGTCPNDKCNNTVCYFGPYINPLYQLQMKYRAYLHFCQNKTLSNPYQHPVISDKFTCTKAETKCGGGATTCPSRDYKCINRVCYSGHQPGLLQGFEFSAYLNVCLSKPKDADCNECCKDNVKADWIMSHVLYKVCDIVGENCRCILKPWL